MVYCTPYPLRRILFSLVDFGFFTFIKKIPENKCCSAYCKQTVWKIGKKIENTFRNWRVGGLRANGVRSLSRLEYGIFQFNHHNPRMFVRQARNNSLRIFHLRNYNNRRSLRSFTRSFGYRHLLTIYFYNRQTATVYIRQ